LQREGACGYFGRTKYADGILPIDTYKNDVDEIVKSWNMIMIGKLLGDLSWSTVLGTQHTVRTNAFREQFRCVKRNQWNRTT